MRRAASALKLRSLNDIGRRFLSLGLGAVLASFAMASELTAAEGPVTVLTATQRREVATVSRGEGELVAIDDVLAGLDVRLTPDPRGQSVTITRGSHELVLHNKKSLASVDGDLKLLPAPVVFDAGRWLVPVEGLVRVLPALLERPVDWRSVQRVLLIGSVPIPRVAVSAFATGDLVRVVFEASESVPFRMQQQTGRVTVAVARDLVDVTLQPQRLAGGIVSGVSFLGGRENVFAVDLGPRFQTVKATEQAMPARLVLEFQGAPLGMGERAAPPAAPRPTPRPSEAEPGVRTVVIDPGHGGENPGARGPGGTVEKDIALAIARRVRAELVNARGLSVFLTRDKDVDMALDDRTAIANNSTADLFVSIHANASRARGAKGSEVYFLSYQASDDDSRRIAQLEGAAEPLPEAAVGTDLALILWDMAQAEHLEESSALASRIQEELAVVTGSEGRGVKQAPFRVLVGASMPAVLVEIAFISNPEEEKLLASEAYQAKIAASLARGIERYRRERSVRLSGSRAVTSATP